LLLPSLSFSDEVSSRQIRLQLLSLQVHFRDTYAQVPCEAYLTEESLLAERTSVQITTAPNQINTRARAWLSRRLREAIDLLNSDERESLVVRIEQSPLASHILRTVFERSTLPRDSLIVRRFEVATFLLLVQVQDYQTLEEISGWIDFADRLDRDVLWEVLTMFVGNFGERAIANLNYAEVFVPTPFKPNTGYDSERFTRMKAVGELFSDIVSVFQKYQIGDVDLLERVFRFAVDHYPARNAILGIGVRLDKRHENNQVKRAVALAEIKALLPRGVNLQSNAWLWP
jgi:hypothetical protein